MLKIEHIREIINLIDKSSIDEFVYKVDDEKLVLKKNNEKIVNLTNLREEVTNKGTIENDQEINNKIRADRAPFAEATNDLKDDQASEEVSDLVEITSPMVGTFYKASSPGAEPYVKIGSKVDEKSVVCIVEAMKLFNEIEAEVKGEVVDILVSDGQLVEYGQPLLLVKQQ